MSLPPIEERIRKAGELIHSARYAVVFTGAGISTPSGIPDFRSAGSGQWTKHDPMKVASLSAFRYRPRDFFDWLRPLAATAVKARPNAAHLAVAELQAAGIVKAVITQNIDGLHQQAGSTGVLEVHGSMETLTCPSCRRKYPGREYLTALVENNEFPHCPADQTILKPDVVLFEEMLPAQVWDEAENASLTADVMIVIGSSLEVGPANMLPGYAVRSGASLIINTRSETYLDGAADVRFPEDVAEVMPAIARQVLNRP